MLRLHTSHRVLGVLAVALAVLFASSGVGALQVDAPDRPTLPRTPGPTPLLAPLLPGPVAGDDPAAARPATAPPSTAPAPVGDRAAGSPPPAAPSAAPEAAPDPAAADPALAARVEGYVAAYNRGVVTAPAEIRERYDGDLRKTVVALSAYEAAKRQVATETVRLELRTAVGETIVVTARTDARARIVDYRLGDATTPAPTILVRTDEATLRRTAAADDPGRAALDALAAGDVTVDGSGVDPVALRNLVELYRTVR